jgi:hypothetical protein
MMDVTISYYLNRIAQSPNKDYWKTKKWIKVVRNEIYAYRSTAYLLKGRNVASLCNHYASQIEKQLNDALKF